MKRSSLFGHQRRDRLVAVASGPLFAGINATVVLGGVLGWAWWSSTSRSFSTSSVVQLGVGIVICGVASIFGRRSRPRAAPPRRAPGTLRRLLPGGAIVVVGVALESVGLALGGRSSTLPTLSDLLDHLVDGPTGRFVTAAVWLGLGLLGSLTLPGSRSEERS